MSVERRTPSRKKRFFKMIARHGADEINAVYVEYNQADEHLLRTFLRRLENCFNGEDHIYIACFGLTNREVEVLVKHEGCRTVDMYSVKAGRVTKAQLTAILECKECSRLRWPLDHDDTGRAMVDFACPH